MLQRTCQAVKQNGERCRQVPLSNSDLCFWHDPSNAEAANQARRLGGQRRRREKITEGAYELGELDSVDGIRRVIEIAILDTLGLENSLGRSRTLIAGSLALAKLLEIRQQAAQFSYGQQLARDGVFGEELDDQAVVAVAAAIYQVRTGRPAPDFSRAIRAPRIVDGVAIDEEQALPENAEP